ncbi:MAG: ABC transporter permease [Planctomycetota bacterium]|nr:ABC transporter permease [Planctomycetota bacterium]
MGSARGSSRGLIASIGAATLGFVGFFGGLALLLRDAIGHLIFGPFRGRGVGWRSFWTQAVRSGPRALPVVFIVNFFVGMIMALIGGKILLRLGVTEYVGDLLGIGIVLELGPLLTGIIMTGYIGAALAAEIGTMVVNDEITALRTMSVNPVRFIVAPRLLAVVLMVPLVTLLGDFVGILGGLLVAIEVLDLSPNAFFEHAQDSLSVTDVWRGLFKATVFGFLIGSIGCYQGFRVYGGAEGVGRVTTGAVVRSIIAIIVADALLNYFLLFRL